jgi:glycine cleavage system aminomethyltransferase T/glycine/D-amino acid oxidase-like deaminating enzyme
VAEPAATALPAHAAIVIVGAGIVGCSAAYALTQRGWRDVVVVEQGPLFATGGSTSHAPGLVFQTNPSKTMAIFAKRAVELYSTFDLDGLPCWHGAGSLEVARTPERWRDLRRKLGWAKSWGIDAALIGPGEVQRLLPLIDPGQILGAYHVPSDGIAKAPRVAEAFARAASATGASFHAHTQLTGFEISNGRVHGVVTSQGVIATEQVLVCCGIWGPIVGRLAGVSIPLAVCQHQYVTTTPLPELAEFAGQEVAHPILRDQDRAMYERQIGDRYGVGSYAHEPLLVDPAAILSHADAPVMPSIMSFTPEHFAGPWNDARDLLPALRGAQITESMNGMFSFTPDGFPLIGEAANVRGFWVAEAVWVTHGGGVGQAVADLITDGRADLDLHDCDLNRFDAYAHTATYVQARGAHQYDEVYDIIHPLQPLENPRPVRVPPFHDREQALGAVFFEARGWERPQWYESNAPLLDEYPVAPRDGWAGMFWSPIAGAEHLAVRERAGLFDMSTLYRIEVTGAGACALLDRLTTNRIDRPAGSVVYSLLLDSQGGIRSDVTIARLGPDHFQLGGNGPLDLDWLKRHARELDNVHLRDISGSTVCIGLWGPRARGILTAVSVSDLDNDAFPYFSARQIAVGPVPTTALRVSYVGELGWELYAPVEYGAHLWDALWTAGQAHGLIATGRAAFETMRLEKGYRSWGTDMTTEHTPAEAGLAFAVKPKKGNFIGRDALTAEPSQVLSCLTLDDPTVVVMGKEPVLIGDKPVGYVTSAGFGFSVGKSIAYAWLPADRAVPGSTVSIEYFGQAHPATVQTDPLFDPKGERLRW